MCRVLHEKAEFKLIDESVNFLSVTTNTLEADPGPVFIIHGW